jgi:hypothetical protein
MRTLAIRDEWFTDRVTNVASKDAALEIVGVLIAEIAEMDAVARLAISDEELHFEAPRPLPSALGEARGLPAAASRVRRNDQPAGGRLFQRPDLCAAVLACDMPWHD